MLDQTPTDQPLAAQIESLLFVATHPLTDRKLAELTGVPLPEVRSALDTLDGVLEDDARGVVLVRNGSQVELATKKRSSALVQRYITDERTGELTKPAIETLTIIAYRGPIAKSELELIRGVNCSLILRNLMMRGLAEVSGTEHGEKRYSVTFEFLHHLGVSQVTELPDYDLLHHHEHLERLLHPETFDDQPQPDADTAGAADEPSAEPTNSPVA